MIQLHVKSDGHKIVFYNTKAQSALLERESMISNKKFC